MSDLYQIIADHLRGACPTPAAIEPATSAAEAEAQVVGSVPIVLVIPAGERWIAVREAGLQVTQAGLISFSCVVAMTAPGGSSDWTAVRTELRAALLGWTPDCPEIAGPVQASGARLLSYSSEAGGRWLHSFDFNLPAQATYGIK